MNKITDVNGTLSISERLANARLISLAPELAEALKECEKHYLPTPLLCRIRSILGKLEGTNES